MNNKLIYRIIVISFVAQLIAMFAIASFFFIKFILK